MQYGPTVAQLLAAVAELLQNTLLPALPPGLQHQARVGANVVRIVGRELELGADAARREAELLAAVPADDDDALWHALVEVVRHDLAMAKPGYDAWEAP
jgi:hypothetical protein